MTERTSSFLILFGGLLAVLALWYLSVLFVRKDTRKRQSRGQMRELDRKLWVGLSIGLPLFGFALYLFMLILRGYLAPPILPEPPHDMSVTAVRHKEFKAQVDEANALRGGTEPKAPGARASIYGYSPAGEPMVKPNKSRSNGVSVAGAHLDKTPVTIAAPYRAVSARYTLVVLQGPDLGKAFPLHPLPLRLGRGADVQISLDDDLNVSRHHAEIYEWNGMLRIRDLGSAHGTLINGIPIKDQALSPGDHLAVGGTVFILQEQT